LPTAMPHGTSITFAAPLKNRRARSSDMPHNHHFATIRVRITSARRPPNIRRCASSGRHPKPYTQTGSDRRTSEMALLPSRPREFHPEPLTGRVEDWRAGRPSRPCHVSSPLHVATQRADFPHCALPFASRQGLWDLSGWGRFRSVASHSIAVE
jgi:hypothetical protein